MIKNLLKEGYKNWRIGIRHKLLLLLLILCGLQIYLIIEYPLKANASVATVNHKHYVSAGYRNSLIMTDDGVTYGCGINISDFTNGSRGLTSSDFSNIPLLLSKNAVAIEAMDDPYSFIAVINKEGNNYLWPYSPMTSQYPVHNLYDGQIRLLNGDIKKTAFAREAVYFLRNDGTAVITGYHNPTETIEAIDIDANAYSFSKVVKDGKLYIKGSFYDVSKNNFIYKDVWTDTGLEDIVQAKISCGGVCVVAIDNRGRVFEYRLGEEPRLVPCLNNIIEVSEFSESTRILALDADGNVFSYYLGGNNSEKVSIDNVIDIDAGNGFAMAVKADGSVWSWLTSESGTALALGLGLETTTSPKQIKQVNVFPKKVVEYTSAVYGPDSKVHKFEDDKTISVYVDNGKSIERTYTVQPSISNMEQDFYGKPLLVTQLENGMVGVVYEVQKNNTKESWEDEDGVLQTRLVTEYLGVKICYYSWNEEAKTYVFNSEGQSNIAPTGLNNKYYRDMKLYSMYPYSIYSVPLMKNAMFIYGYRYVNGYSLDAGVKVFIKKDNLELSKVDGFEAVPDCLIGVGYDNNSNLELYDYIGEYGYNSPGDTGLKYLISNYYTYNYLNKYNCNYLQIAGGNVLYDYAPTVNGTKVYYSNSANKLYVTYSSPPNLSVICPTQNQILGSLDSAFVPIISVSDAEGDQLTCKYYLDGAIALLDTKIISNTVTPQTVAFNPLGLNNLTSGEHSLLIEVYDNPGQSVKQTVKFYIDKTPPVLGNIGYSSTDTSITITATATDTPAGLDPAPYRYTIGGVQSQWTPDTSYTAGSLLPNTLHSVKVEARDNVGNISTKEQSVYTKAQVPGISTCSPAENGIDVVVTDNNPSTTKYQLMFNSMYVAQDGYLKSTPEWITLTGKKVSVLGLTQNTSYEVKAKAKNNEGVETALSNQITGTTLAAPPANITFAPSQTSITVKWDAVPGALSYNVKADGVNGVDMKNITGTSYTHIGLTPETSHNYSVSVNNVAGTGNWSSLVEKATYPYPPSKPVNLAIKGISQKYITLSWEPSVKASEYIVEANGTVIGTYTGTTMTHENLSPDTKYTYRVKAKNIGGESEWSDVISETTWPNIPDVPLNISTRKTNVSIDISWNQSSRAEGYEIWVDGINGIGGMIKSTGVQTSYSDEGLKALESHTYKVRAVNRGGNSDWSTPIIVTTNPDKPNMPNNIMATADKYSITLTWYLASYAESYDIEIDGNEVKKATELSFKNIGLTADTKHTYRVRAVNVTGSSDWSEPVTVSTLPEAEQATTSITNIVAVVTNSYITIAWDDVEKEAEYLIEVDGVLQDIGKTKTYNHTGLSANQFHTYKVKAKTTENKEFWCAVLSLSTLPNHPSAPTGVEATVNGNQIELKWTKGTNDEAYDVEVDGQTLDNGQSNTYDHQNLTPGTAHTYRVRAKNVTGVTAWSTAITKSTATPEYTVECLQDKQFDFSILASNVQDFTGLKFVITYNPDELDIVDLCSFTPEKEVQSNGVVKGTKLSITNTPGKIEIAMKDNIVPGTSWSGEINNIIFKSKINGTSKLIIKLEQ